MVSKWSLKSDEIKSFRSRNAIACLKVFNVSCERSQISRRLLHDRCLQKCRDELVLFGFFFRCENFVYRWICLKVVVKCLHFVDNFRLIDGIIIDCQQPIDEREMSERKLIAMKLLTCQVPDLLWFSTSSRILAGLFWRAIRNRFCLHRTRFERSSAILHQARDCNFCWISTKWEQSELNDERKLIKNKVSLITNLHRHRT